MCRGTKFDPEQTVVINGIKHVSPCGNCKGTGGIWVKRTDEEFNQQKEDET